MTEFQQPASLVDIYNSLPLEVAGELFPYLSDEDKRRIKDEAQRFHEETDKRARAEQLEERAQSFLFHRAALRLADELEAEQSGVDDSWNAVDLDALFDEQPIEPDVGAFTESDTSNGGALFYSAKVNEIHGPSESGKTMVLLAVAAQEIAAGNKVAMVDFEDDGRAIVARLRDVFGLTRQQIVGQFIYRNPNSAVTDRVMTKLIADMNGVTMCIIDAVTESMSAGELDGRNENDVATWYNIFPKRLAPLGPAIVVVDHTPVSDTSRQIGSQHKKSAVDGVSYTAEPIAPMVKGRKGILRLRIAKDKVGAVRRRALPGGEGSQYWRGDFYIDGSLTPETPRWELRGVDPKAFELESRRSGSSDVKSIVLPTPGESRVLLTLAESGEWMTANAIMEWYNHGLDKADAHRLDRQTPRKLAVKLIDKGLVDRRETASGVSYKITGNGLHSANEYVNQRSDQGQTELKIKGSRPPVNPS